MKKILILLMGAALASFQLPTDKNFTLSGEIEGLQKGDTLMLTSIQLPGWKNLDTDTFIVKEVGKFSQVVPIEHSSFFLLTHKPKVGMPLESCIRGAELFAQSGDQIKMNGSLKYLGAVRHSGGCYDEPLIARYDSLLSSTNKEMIDIFAQIIKYRKEEKADSVSKYGQMYNIYRSPEVYREARKQLEHEVNDSEYAALMFTKALHSVDYAQLKERLERFTPEVKASYFGQVLTGQLAIQKNISEGNSPADFTVTDSKGNKVSLSDYKGKYLLIYHWGLCPGTFQVNPKIMELYETYHAKGFEVLGFTKDNLKVSAPETYQKINAIDQYKGLFMHPWTTVYTADTGNEFIEEELYFSGVPILMVISPDGTTLARGYGEVFEKLKKVLEDNLAAK